MYTHLLYSISELGLPHPLSREEAHSLAGEGLGDSQFPIPTTGEEA